VVERDHRMRSKRDGRYAVLVAELVTEEQQRAEADRASLEGHLEALRTFVGVAGGDERATRPDEHAAGGAGRLDRSLDDQGHQQLCVVRRAESLAEARGDVAQPPAFCLELVETGLQ